MLERNFVCLDDTNVSVARELWSALGQFQRRPGMLRSRKRSRSSTASSSAEPGWLITSARYTSAGPVVLAKVGHLCSTSR